MSSFAQELRSARILGILRGCPDQALGVVADAVRLSGLRFLEVTMNTPGAAAQIDRLAELLVGVCRIGAGTVLTADHAQQATDFGATFLVSPGYFRPVQDFANLRSIPTVPGALTPTEIWNTHLAGAAITKIFPARSLGGPAYFKELRGPFRDLPLLACGGVTASNAAEYIQGGADALAIGGSVFTPERLKTGDVKGIASELSALIAAAGVVPAR